MPKATVHDMLAMGFAANQFGGPPDFEEEASGGVLFDLLTAAGLEARVQVGDAVYAAALVDAVAASDQLNFYRLVTAEKNLVAFVLWGRRIAQVDADMMAARNPEGKAELLHQYRMNRDNARKDAYGELEKVSGKGVSGGISMGVVESGNYSAVLTT